MSNQVILLLGDSLIDFGKWQKRLPHYKVISRGVPGEQAEELLRRLTSTNQSKTADAVVVMTGTNNLFLGDTAFADTISSIIQRLIHTHPDTHILVTSLLPYKISGILKKVCAVNKTLRMISEESDAVHYFDLFSAFDQCTEELFDYDGVHLSEAGYRLWAHLLEADLTRRLEKGSD